MFFTVLSNVAILLVYMAFGYILCKAKRATPSHAKTMSGVLLYILNPAMIINSFLQIEFTKENSINILKVFLITLVLQGVFFALLYLIFHKKYADAKYRILSVASVLGNVGYFGLPVIYGIFPDEPIVMCYSSVYVMSMNILVFTVGVYMITNNRKYMSLKGAFINPTSIAICVALPLYFLKVSFPPMISNSISLLGRMVTPMCMFIIGIRLSTEKLKDIFSRPFVYVTCFFKLIVFPVFVYFCVKWLPFIDDVARTSIFVLAAAPAGVIIESLAELHECEQEISANVVLLTTMLSILTMPVILFLLTGQAG